MIGLARCRVGAEELSINGIEQQSLDHGRGVGA
jgi:hypothetical protein